MDFVQKKSLPTAAALLTSFQFNFIDGMATLTISVAPFAPISKQVLPVYPKAFLIELNGWPFLDKSGNTCPSSDYNRSKMS